MKLSIEGSRD